MKRVTLAIPLLLALGTLVPGTAAVAAVGPVAPVPSAGPADVLKEGIGKLTGFLASGGASNPARLHAFLRSEIAPYFDFAHMTQFVAGPRYRFMDTTERARLAAQLQDMFLGAMARHVMSYRSGQIRYVAPRANRATGEVVLGAQIFQPGGAMQRLDFRLYASPAGWKVFDVSANGQSALVYYRGEFARRFRQPPMPMRY